MEKMDDSLNKILKPSIWRYMYFRDLFVAIIKSAIWLPILFVVIEVFSGKQFFTEDIYISLIIIISFLATIAPAIHYRNKWWELREEPITKYRYTDERGQTFGVIKAITGDYWMTDNYNYPLKNSLGAENVTSMKDNPVKGRFYGGIHVPNIAPRGWKVPTSENWHKLFKAYGKSLVHLDEAGFNIESMGLMEPSSEENGEKCGTRYNSKDIYFLTSSYHPKGNLFEILSVFTPNFISYFFPKDSKYCNRILFNGVNELKGFYELAHCKFVPVRCIAKERPSGLQEL